MQNASGTMLFLKFGVFAFEAIYPALCIKQFLFSAVKRMAIRTNVNSNFLQGGTCYKAVITAVAENF